MKAVMATSREADGAGYDEFSELKADEIASIVHKRNVCREGRCSLCRPASPPSRSPQRRSRVT